jgi:hypothetical protein
MATKYPEVEHAHVIPQCYLNRFAVRKKINVRYVADGASGTTELKPTREVGVRDRFYSRTRRDGSRIDDIEWSLSRIETVAPNVLRNLPARWPLSWQDKATLAEFFGIQLVRGPRWMGYHRAFTQQYVNDQAVKNVLSGEHAPHTYRAELNLFADVMNSATPRLIRMLSLGSKVASSFGSMHWTLIEFRTPVVALSDDPIVIWPMGHRTRTPEPTPFDQGVTPALEVRAPISPRHVILMTWADTVDTQTARVQGNRDHASNLNAFTIAQAEREWYYAPGTPRPPVASGSARLFPLSPALVPDYNATVAANSRRRATITSRIDSTLGEDPKPGPRSFEMVWLD